MDEHRLSLMLKALGDEHRIQILMLLHRGQLCACQLLEELNISQSTLSHHMKILCDAGIVIGEKDGKWMHYRICCDGVCQLRSMLRQLLAPDMGLADCICSEHDKL